jgi:pyruvate,water dikinase
MSNATTAQDTHAVRIIAPPEFPVTWEHADDEQLTWLHDRMHNPDPVLPLENAFWSRVYEAFNRATEAYEMPVRLKTRCINTYFYMAAKTVVPPEQMEAQRARADERMDAVMARLHAVWTEEWFPEIRSHLAWWDAFDLTGATVPELLGHLEETLNRLLRLWEIHFRIVLPSYIAMSQFDDLYRDLFDGEGAFGSYRLLQGFDNKTLEADRALWDLSRRALASEEVQGVLEAHPAAEVLAELGRTPARRGFRDELDAYLREYGLRGEKWGLSYPCWIEDPAAAITNLKDYITQSRLNPREKMVELAGERDGAVAVVRGRLQDYPKPVVERFEFLLKAAQEGVVLSEDHGFWIDFGATYRVRRVLLEFGLRLYEAGGIEQPSDVFYVTLDELRASFASSPCRDHRSLVELRRREVAHFRAITPPSALGADNGPRPDDPMGRFFGKFFGGPPPAAESPDVLWGHAGSPGTVRGPAKVIRSLSDAGKLQAGDVLVAETTAPPWTPLFATAAAIVTDSGGVLSHCAVVAREYRIPAVVGTGRATTEIRDGQILEVDGDAGLVRICPA